MKKDSIIEKVKRALALAKDNPNDSEGQTALTLAQRLMVKHDISMSEVSFNSNNGKNVMKKDVTEHKRLRWWERQLASIISENFRCYYWWHTYSGGSVITFMGLEEDVELAKEVYSLSCEAVKYYSKRFIKENNLSGSVGKTLQYKNDYIRGFLSGLSEKFEDQVRQNDWGLVLVKDALVVQTYEESPAEEVEINVPELESMFAMTKGYEDGKTIDHTRKKIGQA